MERFNIWLIDEHTYRCGDCGLLDISGDIYRASEVDALLQAVRGLVEAAKPFAKLLQSNNDNGHNTKPIFAINDALLTLGDLRAIKQAINAIRIR